MSDLPADVANEIAAIQAFILRSTVPIMVENVDEEPCPVGTGTLLKVGDRRFIITAQHLFEKHAEGDLKNLAIPNGITGSGYTRILNLVYSRPTTSEIDIGIIEITNADSVQNIEAHWSFLTLDNVDVDGVAEHVWLVGYPEVNVARAHGQLSTTPVTVLSERLAEAPQKAEQPVYDGLDVFYEYSRTAQVIDKTIQETPDLHGVSGAAVWKIKQSQDEKFWDPARIAKMVGVQSSFIHSTYFRIKSWRAVASAMSKIDEELAQAIWTKTGVQRPS